MSRGNGARLGSEADNFWATLERRSSMGESEGLTFDLITRTGVSLDKVGGEDAFQVGVLGEGGHLFRLI
jgi:hypothetical protein